MITQQNQFDKSKNIIYIAFLIFSLVKISTAEAVPISFEGSPFALLFVLKLTA